MTKIDIKAFRDAIDAIDDQIVDLFNERSRIVKAVGVTKKKYLANGECYIRSGREADVIRRIYTKFNEGTFPAPAAMQMWRTVISASLSLESDLNISVCESDHDVYWLSREYFGNFLPVFRRKTSDAVMNDLKNKKAQVGVFALNEGKWWLNLPQDLKVFACIPFIIGKKDTVSVVAVARLEPEKTEQDVTLLTVTAKKAVNIKQVLKKHGIKAKLLDSKRNAHLVEAEGFISEDETLDVLSKETGFAITVLGAYAVPVRV